jgi:hypothetical protein
MQGCLLIALYLAEERSDIGEPIGEIQPTAITEEG